MMEFLRRWPSGCFVAVAVAGGLLLLWSGWLMWQGGRQKRQGGSQQMVFWGRGLRSFLSGLCLVLGALGALLELRWLVIIALVIGLEELYETSIALFLYRRTGGPEALEPGPESSPGYPPEDEGDEEPWGFERPPRFAEDRWG